MDTTTAVFATVSIGSCAFFTAFITVSAVGAYKGIRADLAEFLSLFTTKES